jgi:polar amino acid transport system permease protein
MRGLSSLSALFRFGILAWLLAIAGPLAFWGAAIAAGPPVHLVSPGALTFCADVQNPPTASYAADGETPVGIAVDVMKALAEAQGLKLKLLNYRAAGIFAALDTRKCDAIMASLSKTPERLKRYDFVDYWKISSGFLVRKDDLARFRSVEDLSGKRIAVLLGSRNEAWLRDQNLKFAAEGKRPMDILSLGTNVVAFQEVGLRRADALLTSSDIGSYYVSRRPDELTLARMPIRPNTTLGIAVLKDNPAVRASLQSTLDALVASGRIQAIVNTWGMSDGLQVCSTRSPCDPVAGSARPPAPASDRIRLHFDLAYFLKFVFQPPVILWQGLVITVTAAVASQLLGTVLGAFLCLAGRSRAAAWRLFSTGYIWFFRGTPVLIQLVLVYFGLPALLGFDLFPGTISLLPLAISGALVAGVLTFALHEAAMMSEIIRGALAAIDRGQMEAAQSLGMWPSLVLRRIVFPQAARLIVPPLGNQFNGMLKTTSLLSVIGVAELFRGAEDMQASSFMTFEVYLGVSVYYLLLTALWAVIQRLIEKRLSLSLQSDTPPAAQAQP